MSGFVDLHCHYLPAIDDGVRTAEDGVALLRGLGRLGWSTVIATPHIRTAMYENRRAGLEQAFVSFDRSLAPDGALPARGLGAEHFFDDVFVALLGRDEAVPYPGRNAALVELPNESIPLGLAATFDRMAAQGIRPVLAHPERYAPVWKSTEVLEPLLDTGAVLLLDVMSLVGRYGERARTTAERLLSDGLYYAACTDAHRSSDVEIVRTAIARLAELVGPGERDALLGENPRRILAGTVDEP